MFMTGVLCTVCGAQVYLLNILRFQDLNWLNSLSTKFVVLRILHKMFRRKVFRRKNTFGGWVLQLLFDFCITNQCVTILTKFDLWCFGWSRAQIMNLCMDITCNLYSSKLLANGLNCIIKYQWTNWVKQMHSFQSTLLWNFIHRKSFAPLTLISLNFRDFFLYPLLLFLQKTSGFERWNCFSSKTTFFTQNCKIMILMCFNNVFTIIV